MLQVQRFRRKSPYFSARLRWQWSSAARKVQSLGALCRHRQTPSPYRRLAANRPSAAPVQPPAGAPLPSSSRQQYRRRRIRRCCAQSVSLVEYLRPSIAVLWRIREQTAPAGCIGFGGLLRQAQPAESQAQRRDTAQITAGGVNAHAKADRIGQ